jgi:hypothetical protein
MKNRVNDLRTFREIEDLASASPRRMFALSPNDVLVQVSLPLVLILAILTRLMVIGQTLTTQERGPVILEMWKQQLILRMDRVLSDWERAAQLPALPEFSRIQWEGALPNDTRYQTLCESARTLDTQEELAMTLYHRSLRFGVEDGAEDYLLALYDPEAPFAQDSDRVVPPEFTITPERRAYALEYINDRLTQWRQHVENLQWSTVAASAARLPFEEDMDEARMAAQMATVARALEDAGYPLLQSVREEFGGTL